MNDLQATSSYSGISILFKAQCLDLLLLLVGFSKLFKNPKKKEVAKFLFIHSA